MVLAEFMQDAGFCQALDQYELEIRSEFISYYLSLLTALTLDNHFSKLNSLFFTINRYYICFM